MALIGTPVTRSHFPSFVERNLRHGYLMRYTDKERPAQYPSLFSVLSSDCKIEREAVAAGLGTYSSKEEGSGTIAYDAGQEMMAQSYTHQTYMLGIQVTKEAEEDDIHGVVKKMVAVGGALAAVAKYTKERDAMSLFNTYLTTDGAYTFEGTSYALLETAHPTVDSTWANTPTNGPDLSYEAMEFAIAHWMANMVDPRGLLSNMMPGVLLAGVNNWGMAHRILKTMGAMPGSANNDVNAVTDQFTIKPVIHKLLTNDGRWLLLAPQDPDYGLRYYERVRPGVIRGSDTDTGDYRYWGRYRCSSGASHVFGVWGVS